MTNRQRQELADMYKAREREIVVSIVEMLLEGVEDALKLPDDELRENMTELRDKLAKGKAEGWPGLEVGILLPSERPNT